MEAQEENTEERKVLAVRALCELGASGAPSMAATLACSEADEYEVGVYQKRKARALEIADTITEEFYSEAAAHSLVELCMAAGEVDEARGLLKRISTEYIRERIPQWIRFHNESEFCALGHWDLPYEGLQRTAKGRGPKLLLRDG